MVENAYKITLAGAFGAARRRHPVATRDDAGRAGGNAGRIAGDGFWSNCWSAVKSPVPPQLIGLHHLRDRHALARCCRNGSATRLRIPTCTRCSTTTPAETHHAAPSHHHPDQHGPASSPALASLR